MKKKKSPSLTSIIAIAFLLIASLAGCSANSTDSEPAPASEKSGKGESKLIGSYTIYVDPHADVPVRVVNDGTIGAAATALQLTTSASFTSMAAWDAATNHLNATVYIQSLDAANNWNEPSMVITSISSLGAIQFQGVNAGTFSTSTGGGAGSTYAFADIEKSGGYDYAFQKITISDPSIAAFSFQADLYAVSTAGAIDPDRDHDGWNSESGAAGNDCDDSNPAKYPGGGACTCGTTIASCSSCAATDHCCSIANNVANCGTGCTCTETQNANAFNFASCAAGSSCAFTVGGHANTTIASCGSGSSCAMTCTSPNSSCTIATCTGSDCLITATGKTAGVSITSCAAGSTCQINCATNSTCSLTCSDATSSCTITNCASAGIGTGDCHLTCPSGAVTYCANGSVTCGGPAGC